MNEMVYDDDDDQEKYFAYMYKYSYPGTLVCYHRCLVVIVHLYKQIFIIRANLQ